MTPSGPIAIVRTPRFGVCVDAATEAEGGCVLARSACGAGQVYRAPFETDLACEDPGAVGVGRCASSLDDGRCGPSASACGTRGPFYDAIDPSCSAVADDGRGGARTTYPGCRDADSGAWRCVLDGDECSAGEVPWYAKWVEDWGDRPCRCEDVPTGACYVPAAREDGPAPGSSFCAVSRDDCPGGHDWMAAREFLDSDIAAFECRMCDGRRIGPRGRDYPAGGCLKPGASSLRFDASDVEICAMESIDCAGGSQFVSSAQLERRGLACPIQHTRNWGVCASLADKVDCTNKASSCHYDFRFEVGDGDVPQCDVHFSASGVPTYYPYCAPRIDQENRDWRVVRCVWDESECDSDTERWEEARLPDQAWFEGCTCEDVLTGVCRDPSTEEYHCAVSAQACEDPSSYLERHRLKAMGIDADCQLCSPSSRPSPPPTPRTDSNPASVLPGSDPRPSAGPVAVPVPPPSSPPADAKEPFGANVPVSDPSPVLGATATPTVTKVSSKAETPNSGQGGDLAMGEVIGILVGVLAVSIVILGCVVRAKRADKDQERTFQTENPAY